MSREKVSTVLIYKRSLFLTWHYGNVNLLKFFTSPTTRSDCVALFEYFFKFTGFTLGSTSSTFDVNQPWGTGVMFWKRPHRRTTCSHKELRLVTELDLFQSGTSWTRPTPGHVSSLIVFIMHSFIGFFYRTGGRQLLVPLLVWSVSLVMLIDGGEHACGESQRWGKTDYTLDRPW